MKKAMLFVAVAMMFAVVGCHRNAKPAQEEVRQVETYDSPEALFNAIGEAASTSQDPQRTIKMVDQLVTDYPDYENMDAVYYHLFLLYNRMEMPAIADGYVEKLKEQFPESQWTGILSDPYFKENAIFGEQMEDSLYSATYNAFKADRYSEVKSNARISTERFPLGANRDKFLFIDGLGKLNDGDGDGCLENMKTLVEKFPQSKLSEMAGMIINGVKAGKQLHGGKFDLGDVWSRRSMVLSDSDSIAAKKLSAERNVDFLFMVVYKPDSVNENQLLYELARYNFTSYMVRNFDITIEQDELGLHHMQVSGFRNFDEALQYARELYQQANIVKRLGKSRSIVISTENFPLLGKQYSYDDYDEFYTKHFAPLKVSTFDLLSEPAELGYDKEEDIPMLAHTCCYSNGRDGKRYGFTVLDENDVIAIYKKML